LLAARRNKRIVTQSEFEEAKDKVMMGAERRSMAMSEDEKRLTAYHEAGHAIVSWMMPENDPVQKISIVPRGMSALGYTMNIPLEDRYLMTKSELLARICGLLGGRIAEQIIFNEISTGAQNDLEKITSIAYNMVMVYGMSEKLGNLSFFESNNPYYGSPGIDKKYGEETARLIDREVIAIVEDARLSVMNLLTANRDKLEKLASELLLKEMLQYSQIEEILGKRPESLFPVQPEEDDAPEQHIENLATTSPTKNTEQLSQKELTELEEAVARLREERKITEN
jgi:cell division protease FtsH